MSMKRTTKVCGVAVLVLLLVFAALGPANWVPRTGLGWQIDHVVGYFAFTLMVYLAWPRAVVAGGAVMAFAVLLEGLQAFTPDRHPDLQAALYSAGGVLAAALPADLFIRAPTRLTARTFLMPQFFMLRWPFWNDAHPELLTASRRGRVLGSGVARSAGTAITGIGRYAKHSDCDLPLPAATVAIPPCLPFNPTTVATAAVEPAKFLRPSAMGQMARLTALGS
jgi:VanZ family protein